MDVGGIRILRSIFHLEASGILDEDSVLAAVNNVLKGKVEPEEGFPIVKEPKKSKYRHDRVKFQKGQTPEFIMEILKRANQPVHLREIVREVGKLAGYKRMSKRKHLLVYGRVTQALSFLKDKKGLVVKFGNGKREGLWMVRKDEVVSRPINQIEADKRKELEKTPVSVVPGKYSSGL